jgi:uncharacterized protein YciI
MKILITLIFFAFCYSLSANDINPNYNKQLADSLGADEYGMKMYYLVILKTGPNNIEDKTKRDSVFRGHLANLNRLADEGKLIVAGPLAKNEMQYRGIFILNAKSKEEAEKLLDTDPAIKEKVFVTDILGWYGSAALPEYLKFHKMIEKSKP